MISIPTRLQNDMFNFVLLRAKEKIPFERGWQNIIIKYNDSKLTQHLLDGGNYGVIGGGDENIIIVDFDSDVLQNVLKDELPSTFSVKTGSGLLHLYFKSNKSSSFKILNENKDTLSDVQGTGKQVVGPNSIHPNGNAYEVVNDVDLAFIEYDELKALLMKYDFAYTKNQEPITTTFKADASDNEIFDLIAQKVKIRDVLISAGISVNKNPTNCPFHNSKGGRCFGFEDDYAHCFHCDDKWNVFSLVKQINNTTPKETLELICKDYGLEDELKKTRDDWKEKNANTKGECLLPSQGKLVSEFSSECANTLKTKNVLFYRPSAKEIVEVKEITDENKKTNKIQKYLGFNLVTANSFITILERYITPGLIVPSKDDDGKAIPGEFEFSRKSLSNNNSSVVLASNELQSALPCIERIFTVPIPIVHDGVLTFPKIGYDERFNSWLPTDAPTITEPNMTIEDAKATLADIFGDFCFKSSQDYSNAIAGLLTPFLKGLMSTFSTRCPIFFYIANRERAGKDYMAGITGIIYEGTALEEPPISTDNKFENADELRKKILSALISGRKRLHFSNNKGIINNAFLEQIATNPTFSDRKLGQNDLLIFDNELDFSLSGNSGINWTADFANRTKFIRLFLMIEDANKRTFKRPNLHLYIKENRSVILSALYALVRDWFEKGSIKSKIPFTSFPEWASICGGIMENAKYRSPCLGDEDIINVGGDNETNNLKKIWELCYKTFPETPIKRKDIKDLIRPSNQTEYDIFSYLDILNNMGDMVKFGIIISKNAGRIFSDIQMNILNPASSAQNHRIIFTKQAQEIVTKEDIFKSEKE